MINRKGFAPILLIVAAVIVVAVLGAGYVITKNKTGSPGILPKVQLPGSISLNANCELKDPELCRYLDKTTKSMESDIKNGFSGRSVTVDKSGRKSETVWEMQGDKTHFQSTENGKESFNTITIGDTTYTKDMADGKWFKFTAKTGQSSAAAAPFDVNSIKKTMEDTVKEIKDQTTYKAMGKAPCGSLTCFKYEIMTGALPDGKQYMYFDDREYMMRMMEMESSYGTTTTYFDYKPISVSAPSPVKEGEGFNLYDPGTVDKAAGSASSVDMEKLRQNVEEMMKSNSQVPPANAPEGSSEGE